MWCHMSGSIRVQSAINHLHTRKGHLRCEEVKRLLESLGFEVKDGKKGGHKVYMHDGISEFYSSSFNCGHGKNPEIKVAYIRNIIGVIEELKTSIAAFLDD